MSSSERPPSQASTTIESPTPTAESDNPAPAQSIDEKLDPWLVSFLPDDPENPMVRCACWGVFTPFNPQHLVDICRTGPDGNAGTSQPSEAS
jgi:hypothetical protein